MPDILTNLAERSRAFAARSAAQRSAGIERSTYTGGRGFRSPMFQLTEEGEFQPVPSGYGFKRFWQGRPELTGTLPMDHDWLSLDRPAVIEGEGPIAPFGGRAAKRFGERQQRRFEQQHLGGSQPSPDPYSAPRSEHHLTDVRETPRRGAERPGTQFSPERLGIGGQHLPNSTIERTASG